MNDISLLGLFLCLIASSTALLESKEDSSPLNRFKRSNSNISNLDIRDAILQLLNVIRDSNQKLSSHDLKINELSEKILSKISTRTDESGMEKKIDNISTFLLRMNTKLDTLVKATKKQKNEAVSSSGSSDVLETLAKESLDILNSLPALIEKTKESIAQINKDSDKKFEKLEIFILDEKANSTEDFAKVLKVTEEKILSMSDELKEIVVESGHMAESLFERVNDGYHELSNEIKGLANVEQVLLDTADSVMDTKRKLEFGVQQIIFKVSELVKLSGGKMDENLKGQFEDVTRVILSNQNEALGNLTTKVEKEIGQVWRQMGIMYTQVSNSISILEKVKNTTESYVNNTGKNLGSMEGQVEGLTDSMIAVDSNLNYMLGQLSLVVQEFNAVKTGLGEAMTGLGDELKEIKIYEAES